MPMAREVNGVSAIPTLQRYHQGILRLGKTLGCFRLWSIQVLMSKNRYRALPGSSLAYGYFSEATPDRHLLTATLNLQLRGRSSSLPSNVFRRRSFKPSYLSRTFPDEKSREHNCTHAEDTENSQKNTDEYEQLGDS